MIANASFSVCVHARFCIYVSIDMRFLTSKPSALLSFITLLFIVVVVIIIIDFYYENENFTLANNTSAKIIMINEKQNRKSHRLNRNTHIHTNTFYRKSFSYESIQTQSFARNYEIFIIRQVKKNRHERCAFIIRRWMESAKFVRRKKQCHGRREKTNNRESAQHTMLKWARDRNPIRRAIEMEYTWFLVTTAMLFINFRNIFISHLNSFFAHRNISLSPSLFTWHIEGDVCVFVRSFFFEYPAPFIRYAILFIVLCTFCISTDKSRARKKLLKVYDFTISALVLLAFTLGCACHCSGVAHTFIHSNKLHSTTFTFTHSGVTNSYNSIAGWLKISAGFEMQPTRTDVKQHFYFTTPSFLSRLISFHFRLFPLQSVFI